MRYARTGDLRTEIETLARPLVEERRTPGLVVGVLLPDGAATCVGFGVAGPQDRHPPDGDTLFAIGSTNPFPAGTIPPLCSARRVCTPRPMVC